MRPLPQEGDEQQQEDEFQEILDEQGWKHDELLNRYDLVSAALASAALNGHQVIHLETAAIDTEVYDNASKNNIARHESKSQAIGPMPRCWLCLLPCLLRR